MSNTHGGANRNQGRKPIENPKQNITFRLPIEFILFLKSLPKGHKIGFIEDALSAHIQKYNRKNIESFTPKGE